MSATRKDPIGLAVYYVLLMTLLAGCAATPHTTPIGPITPLSLSIAPPFSQPQSIYHEVGPSETLWRISKTYDVAIDTLLRVNHLENATKIQKGQKLLIPNTLGPRPVIRLYPTHRWTHIVIHHTATHEGNAYSIDQLHHKRGFWNGLGYHFLINNGTNTKVDGQIEVGPRWIKQEDGAHANADGMNQKGIGIALVGNYSEQTVSKRELDSLVYLVKTLQSYYHIPNDHVIGHRDVPGKNTECPGTRFPWEEFKSRL